MDTLLVNTDARGVARITMNRPEVFNAFNEVMIQELDQAVAALSADPAVRVIVLAGAGRAFSAGADIQWMQRASEADLAWNEADARRFAGMLHRLHHCPKPTVARVQGLALGGGAGLLSACDIAIASEDVKLAVSEARFGILPAVIGPYVLAAVGPRQAQRLALTGSRIGAHEAAVLGFFQSVVQAEALDAAVDHCVSELLQCGPNAQTEIKQLFAQLAAMPIDEAACDLTARTIARVRRTDEARAGFAAFRAKQAAPWVPSTGEPT